MQAPILLLDVDGVLHPLGSNSLPAQCSLDELSARTDEGLERQDEEGYVTRAVSGEFTEPCMTALRRVVDATSCRIVLSSTWREQPCDRRCVDAILVRHGLPATSDVTPRLGGRGAEILAWVREAGAERWVAVDDASLGSTLPAEHFVQTDAALGLTTEDADAIVALLLAPAAPSAPAPPPAPPSPPSA